MHIDTLSIARDLKATELPPEQAEAIAAAIGRSVTDSISTKSDLEQVRLSLKADIEQVRSGVDLKVEQLRTEIERARNQLFVGMLGLAGVVIAAVRFL